MSEYSSKISNASNHNSSNATLSSTGSSFSDSFDENGSLIPPTYDILPSNHNIIKIAVLSSWDNVIGPKALCVWQQNYGKTSSDCEKPFKQPFQSSSQNNASTDINIDEAVKYVVGHTLHGELSKEATQSSNLRTEIFVIPHRNFIVNAIIFGVQNNENDSIGHSFSIVCSYDNLEYFMNIQQLCDDWQQRVAAKLRVFLSKGDISGGIEKLSIVLLNFSNMLCSLKLTGLTNHSTVSESFLSMRHILDRQLLERALVSHLQTCGCSVVVGDDVKAVNLMINTLSQFVSKKDLSRCRPVIREKSWPYYSGLLIQGLLKDQYSEIEISAQDVLHSLYPITIIDLAKCNVRQSLNFHEHSMLRKKILKQELIDLIANYEENENPTSCSLFQHVAENGALVPELLVELSTLPPTESVLQRHIQDFYRKLEYKAVSAIKYLQYLRDKSMVVNIKVMQKFLALKDMTDVLIILAVAERLNPGIYSYVHTGGQPSYV